MTPIGASAGLLRLRGASEPPPPPPPPPPGGSDFSLTGNPSFDPDAPVLKNGVTLTGNALATWAGIRWLVDNHEEKRYIENGGANVNALAARDNLYHLARMMGVVTNELAAVLRITGWLDVLDEWVRLLDIQYNTLHTGYDEAWLGSNPRWPTHPYLRWIWGENDNTHGGADYHPLDNIRTHGPVCQLLLALRANQHLTSPAGYDYEAKADKWEAYLRDWVKVWQGPEQALGEDANGNPASGWSANYRGNLHNYYNSLVGNRAGAGEWPIQSRHHAHTHVGACAAHAWLGLAIPEFSEAASVGVHGITELYFARNLFYYGGEYGQQMIWPRSLWFTGHSSGGNYPQPSAYIRFIVMDLFNMWLEGLLPTMPDVWARPGVRTWNQYMFDGLSSSQGMAADTLANGTKTGSAAPVNSKGQRLDFVTSVGQSGNQSGSPKSNSNFVSSPMLFLLPWDTPDNKLENHAWDRMGRSSAFYDGSDPKAQPQVFSASIGTLLKQVGAHQWTPGVE